MNAIRQDHSFDEAFPLRDPCPDPAAVSANWRWRQDAPQLQFRNPRRKQIKTFVDERGYLGVVEGADLGFDIRRIYYIYGAGSDTVRGMHAHKQLEQLIICMHGRCTITFHNGHQEFMFVLDKPESGIYVPPRTWRSIKFDKPDTVCCVLASRSFEADDYIHSFEEFLDFIHDSNRLVEHA